MGVPQNIWFIGGNPNLKWMIRGYPYIYILYISIHIPHNEEEKPLGPHFFLYQQLVQNFCQLFLDI